MRDPHSARLDTFDTFDTFDTSARDCSRASSSSSRSRSDLGEDWNWQSSLSASYGPTSHLKCLVYHWSSSWQQMLICCSMLSNVFWCFSNFNLLFWSSNISNLFVLCPSRRSAPNWVVLQAQAVSMPSISRIIESLNACPNAPIHGVQIHIFSCLSIPSDCETFWKFHGISMIRISLRFRDKHPSRVTYCVSLLALGKPILKTYYLLLP